MTNDSLPGNPWEGVYNASGSPVDVGPATMALAYEQRTANLIAYMGANVTNSVALRRAIAERLALNPTTSDPL